LLADLLDDLTDATNAVGDARAALASGSRAELAGLVAWVDATLEAAKLNVRLLKNKLNSAA
jgi:hypothetical protein